VILRVSGTCTTRSSITVVTGGMRYQAPGEGGFRQQSGRYADKGGWQSAGLAT